MDHNTYETEAKVESVHWWFSGRRWLFRQALCRGGVPADAEILDVGTSTGTNLRMLRDAGYIHYRGLDLSDDAIEFCRQKGLGDVVKGDACNIPFAENSFDAVLATDVLEHLDDDGQALAEIQRVLRPGGITLITVPAFPWLWGLQDVAAHHKRRYDRRRLVQTAERLGFKPLVTYHFNFILLVPILVVRRLLLLFRPPLQNENQMNNRFLNAILTVVFRVDLWLAMRLRPPIGVSQLLICAKAPRP